MKANEYISFSAPDERPHQLSLPKLLRSKRVRN